MSEPKSKRPPRNRTAAPAIAAPPPPAVEAPASPVVIEPAPPPAVVEPAAILEPVPAAAPRDEAPVIDAVAKAVTAGSDDLFATGRTTLDALAESQTAVARGFGAIATETAALVRSGISAAADAGSAMLDARTFAEAIEVQAGFARRSIDAALDGSARLSEIAAKTAAEASRPILSWFDDAWRGIG